MVDNKVDQPSSKPLCSTRLMLELCIDLRESDTSDENVRAILKRIVPSVVTNFSLLEYTDHLSHRGETNNTHRMTDYKENPALPLEELFGHLGQQDQHELLARIDSQCVELAEKWFRTFAIPFCCGLTSFLDISSPQCQQCIQTLLDQYIRRTVGPEPEQPTDWRRPDEVASKRWCSPNCGCVEKIDAFLLDPETASLEIHCRASNISGSFNHFSYFEVSGDEGRTRTITKTTKLWGEKHNSWKDRASGAISAVKTISEPVLKEVLGDRYDSILELHNVRAAGGVNLQSEGSGRVQTRSVAGRKRLRAETSSSPETSQDELSLDYKLMGCQRIQEDVAGPPIFVRMM